MQCSVSDKRAFKKAHSGARLRAFAGIAGHYGRLEFLRGGVEQICVVLKDVKFVQFAEHVHPLTLRDLVEREPPALCVIGVATSGEVPATAVRIIVRPQNHYICYYFGGVV